jgi:Domain of unknown function (DUF1854)
MNPPFELQTDAKGRLVLNRPGEEPKSDVRVRRAFPWSEPGRYISLRDSEGKELILIEDLAVIDPHQRQLIESALAATSFIPRIVAVREVDVRFGHQQWRVVTDRGPIDFRVQEREDIRFLADGRFRIKDADGNVYELPRLTDLDAESRRAVEPLL